MMDGSLTRRGVLTGAAALAGASAFAPLFNRRQHAVGHLVRDERLADSARFAAGFAGVQVYAVNALEDLCSRWYLDLRRKVLANGAAIAGLTSWTDYLIMHSCAAEIGYRGTFRWEHRPDASGVEHRGSAQGDVTTLLSRLERPQEWAQRLGRALSVGLHQGGHSGTQFQIRTERAASGHVSMVSWIFAHRN